jgi:hypothetical protein
VIDEGLSRPQPDWQHLLTLAERLCTQIDVAITFVAAQPPLSPLFDDLVPLRRVRAALLVSRKALTTGELARAREAFTTFIAGFPGVEGLITLRSASAVKETHIAANAASAAFAKPGATAAELAPLVALLLDRYNVGLNLTDAAARAADLHKVAPTAEDRTGLIQLNEVALGLRHSLSKFPSDLGGAAAGAATGPGSDFARVQPILEAKARRINTAAALRKVLAGYQDLVLANPRPSTSQVATANKTALEAVALAEQTLVGQFWADPALQAFLGRLPGI